MRLTDRIFATGITKQDLIHIVITGDTTQSPEGSSYKAPVGQILELYNLPVPNIKIKNVNVSVETLNTNNTVGPYITLINPPFITVNELSQEQIDNNVFIEMVQYKNKKKSRTINTGPSEKFTGGRYVVQPGVEDDGLGNVRNILEYKILNYYGKKITNRGGIQTFNSSTTPLAVNRLNHYQVSSLNQEVNLSQYFAGKFTYDNINYINEFGANDSISNIPVPSTNRCKNASSTNPTYSSTKSKLKSGITGIPYRLCYNGNLTSLYVAFRYVMFDPYSNNGNGKFVTGPLTPIIKVTNRFFPVTKTSTEGWCRTNLMIIGSESEIMFSFINKP